MSGGLSTDSGCGVCRVLHPADAASRQTLGTLSDEGTIVSSKEPMPPGFGILLAIRTRP